MKSETEILGELDALLTQLPDDAARERAFAWLRAKHAPTRPHAELVPPPRETAHPFNPQTWIPAQISPQPALHPDLGPPFTIYGQGQCPEGVSLTTDEPRHYPPEFFQAQQGGIQLACAEGILSWNAPQVVASCPTTLGSVWTGETRPSPFFGASQVVTVQ